MAIAARVLDQVSKSFTYCLCTISPPMALFGLAHSSTSFLHATPASVTACSGDAPVGQWVLLGIKAGAVLLLWLCLRAKDRLTALSLGLIIGAIGNAIDRLVYGWVRFRLFPHFDAELAVQLVCF